MLDQFMKPLVKLWLRRYKKQTVAPSVRAVFLGDAVSTDVILHGAYERYEIDALTRYVFPNLPNESNCLDIGANIGNHTNSFSPYFKYVYAFEPNPIVQLILRANTMGQNVQVIECGLSNQKSKVPFMQLFANLGASRITDQTTADGQSIQVERLDDIVASLGIKDVSFIKMDVEGHEQQALEGGIDFLKREQPIIAMESFFKENPSTGKQITQILTNVGYSYFYELVPKSYIIRQLASTSFKRLFWWLIPAHWRKTLVLRRIETLDGIDCSLTISSSRELLIL